MPTRAELIATGRTVDEIAREIGTDAVIYQDLDALRAAVRDANPRLEQFESSCFDNRYITGDVTNEYLAAEESRRNDKRQEGADESEAELTDINLTA